MSKTKIVTAQELAAVKYGDLLQKFTELGVESCWKAGTKKVSMIESAIEKLKIKVHLEEKGLDQVEVEKEIKEIDNKKKQAIEAEKLKAAIEVEEKDKQVVKQIVESKISKQQIETNLEIIKKNLINVIPAHRIILLKKQELLEKMLSEV